MKETNNTFVVTTIAKDYNDQYIFKGTDLETALKEEFVKHETFMGCDVEEEFGSNFDRFLGWFNKWRDSGSRDFNILVLEVN
jgi:hypothetical protein